MNDRKRNENARRWLAARRVAVLKGGWSRERSISLKTGAAVEASLRRLGMRPIVIDVDRGVGHELRKRRVQFAFIALHGAFGEDGGVQSLLDTLRIPYTGSGPAASAIAMDKEFSKKIFAQSNVPTPPWVIVDREAFRNDKKAAAPAKAMIRNGAVFVKPTDQGSALGASRAASLGQLQRSLSGCFRYSSRALVERFVGGRELTVGILGEKALPVVEIIPVHAFYDFHSKYARGGSRHLVPATLSAAQTREAQRLARASFDALKCEVYGRVDVLMAPSGRMTVLEVNTIPGMTGTSLLPDAAAADGLSFDDLTLSIMALSLRARGAARLS